MTVGSMRDRVTIYRLDYEQDGRSTTRKRGDPIVENEPCKVDHKAPGRGQRAGGEAVLWAVTITLRYRLALLDRVGMEAVWHRSDGDVTLEVIGPRTPDRGPPRWLELYCEQTEGRE